MLAARGLYSRGWIGSFFLIFLPLALLLTLIMYTSYQQELSGELRLLQKEDQHQIKLQHEIISSELEELYSDLMLLADLYTEHDDEPSARERNREFQSFMTHREIFDQVRVIDLEGMETSRINYNNGAPRFVKQEELQNKRSRYYFQETIKLDHGQVFISRFDLNMEHGKIERPHKPVLRVSTPVYDHNGNKDGIIILNYLGEKLFEKMHRAHIPTGCELMLLNEQGYWLVDHHGNSDKKWGFMFPEGKDWTFANSYPHTWLLLVGADKGQQFTERAAVTWKSFIPHELTHMPGKEYAHKDTQVWKIVMMRSVEFMDKFYWEIRKKYLTVYIILLVFLLMAVIALLYYRNRERELEKNRAQLQEARLFTNGLLEGALSPRSLEQELEHSLEGILSLSWLSILSKGSIFLMDDESNELVMVVEKGLAKPLLTSCARLKMGQCLCGTAAQSKEIVFSNCLDHRHEITFEGITEHGHICTPIMKGDKVLGVLNLYVEHGHRYQPIYDDLLSTISKALASLIEKKQTDEKLTEAHIEVRKHRDELTFERKIIEETLLRVRSAEAFEEENIRYLMSPVETTAGDFLLSARRPDGVYHLLLGDFTGHGLPAALSGPTVADTFYAMTKKGVEAVKILTELNDKLFTKLPTGLYLATCFIEFDPETQQLFLWNAGLPCVLQYRGGAVINRYDSNLVPLGITAELPLMEKRQAIDFNTGDRFYTYSDGVTEATNISGELFGQEKFETLLSRIITDDLPLETVLDVIMDYQYLGDLHDDVTVLELTA